MIKVSVVILNWNGRELLQRFLPSVTRFSEEDGAEVVVADNGSTDDSVALVQRDFPSVRLVLLPQNFGFAEGYNHALQQVEATYVVLLNSDVEVTRHWLQPLVHYLDTHPQVAGCQPKLLSWHHRNMFEYAGACGGFLDSLGYPYCRGRLMSEVEADKGQYDSILPVAWATGAALCIRLADYRQAGGLDARFFAHMEEVDLCWRLWNSGRQLACVPQSVVYHVGGGTLQKENPRKTFLNFRNNLLMLHKNLPVHMHRKVMLIRFFLDYLAALSFLLKGEWRSAWMVAKARRAYRQMRHFYIHQQSATQDVLPRFRTPPSLLWAFYIKRVRTFSNL